MGRWRNREDGRERGSGCLPFSLTNALPSSSFYRGGLVNEQRTNEKERTVRFSHQGEGHALKLENSGSSLYGERDMRSRENSGRSNLRDSFSLSLLSNLFYLDVDSKETRGLNNERPFERARKRREKSINDSSSFTPPVMSLSPHAMFFPLFGSHCSLLLSLFCSQTHHTDVEGETPVRV